MHKSSNSVNIEFLTDSLITDVFKVMEFIQEKDAVIAEFKNMVGNWISGCVLYEFPC